MEGLLLILVFLLVYPYILYPGAVFVLSSIFRKGWKRAGLEIPITIIVSVYNEERVIRQKVLNALSLEYPESLLEIIVASDGSKDRTNQIIYGFNDPRLRLKDFSERSGKTACLNRVVPQAEGDIVLFTDANSMFPSDILPRLVRNFSDENVGLVTGWSKYERTGNSGETAGIYSRLEMRTKYWESLISSCVGADGAIFAIRKELYKPLDDEDINDFVIPLHIISQGKRVVLDPDVYCLEEQTKGEGNEYRRQARITNRTLRAIFGNPGFLNPFRYGSFSFFLLSHKLLRFSVPFFAIGAFLVNLFLLSVSPVYIGLLLIQLLFLTVGLASLVGKVDGRVANVCKLFLVTLSAQFTGWVRRFRGISDTMWTPQR